MQYGRRYGRSSSMNDCCVNVDMRVDETTGYSQARRAQATARPHPGPDHSDKTKAYGQ